MLESGGNTIVPAPVSVAVPLHQRLVQAGTAITEGPPVRIDFLHSVMCQVGLPRRRTEARTFERCSGHASILLEAGKLWNGLEWVDQPLPYGVIPRLVMVHASSEAVRTQQRTIEIGQSMRQFLLSLGMQATGGVRGGYASLKLQMEALAACRLTIGMCADGKVITKDAKPFSRFEAWLHEDGTQRTLWPGVLELSAEFFATLTGHAVPLDPRALAALKHSALALDVYAWLAHRLHRISNPRGIMLSWNNLREQFGQEYRTSRDFKREFKKVLRQVLAVYPAALIQETIGGVLLHASCPPLAKSRIAFKAGLG